MELLTIFLQADPDGYRIDEEFNWPLATFLVGLFISMAAVLIVVIWQGMATWRARMSVAREAAYRQLADDSVKAQERTADRLDRAVAELTDLRQRTAELERLLKEVG